MKLEKLILEGFRGYRERREVAIDQLTALIGTNDVGKSSLLEALDAFFNGVADPQDATTQGPGTFKIGCVFTDLPQQINLDATAVTILADEYLLNQEQKLEIYKEWRTTKTKAEVDRIYANAYAPQTEAAHELLFKKRDELRALVDQYGLEVNKNRNPEMRKAIYDHLHANGGLNLAMREVDLDRLKDPDDQLAEARKVWKKLNARHLPVFTLFKSEQVRGDKETTVRTPLDATLKGAIQELEEAFAPIADQILNRVKEATNRTLERLRQDYPELEQSLVPDYKPPTWSKAFDLDVLRGEDDVPLNKRGAGVRRLVVLAFFQSEAEKKRADRTEEQDVPTVIYAIEEPETSQHPAFQRSIIQAFTALADAGDQVLLTTHVPGLAELLPTSSIRYIDRPEGHHSPRIRSGKDDKQVLAEAASSLGVYPTADPRSGAQIAVWVEGKTDVWVLEAIARALDNAGRLPPGVDLDRIYYVIGGSGDNLKTFINGEYLALLGLPQFFLRDSDKNGPEDAGKPIPHDVRARVDAWETDGTGMPIAVCVTRKREIENYVDPIALDRLCDCDAQIGHRVGEIDWDFTQISRTNQPFWRALCDAKAEIGFMIPDTVRRGERVKHQEPKHVICGVLIPEMTLEELEQRCASTDDPEAPSSEIEGWFAKIGELIAAQA